MSGFGVDRLTKAQKRALLAEQLRSRVLSEPRAESKIAPRFQPNEGRRSFLDNEVMKLASVAGWNAEEQDPYIRYVSPYKGFLYQHLNLDKTFVRGEGCYLTDSVGDRYADFIAQFGAVPFGHNPDSIWQALELTRQQSTPNLAITSIQAVQGELAEQLLAIAPPGFSHVVFTNSGAESIEAAVKLARSCTGRIGILSARGGFHGLTLAGMSATDTEFFQRRFGAPVSGFNVVPFGDLAALEAALDQRPDYFAGFMLEIIQGESGIRVAPPGYLAAVRELCRRYGVLLIVDEVQTGLGRTGRLFACEAERITPDILALAKALGGGLMPIGACLYTSDVYTEDFDLRHGSTFGGNALACRAAMAAIEQLTKNDQALVRHVASLGDRLREKLQKLQQEYPFLIREIRGRGLMVGVELDFRQLAERENSLISICQEFGLLLYVVVSYLLNVEHIRIAPSFTHGTVLRIEPPLTANDEMCDHLVQALKRLLGILERGDSGKLFAHFMGSSRLAAGSQFTESIQAPSWQPAIGTQNSNQEQRRFAFVVHLLGIDDFRYFDRSLEVFGDPELERLKSRLAPFMRPFPLGKLAVQSIQGKLAEGELIVLPLLPSELLALSKDEAVELVQSAVDLAAGRDAEVIGLAGFSSIVTYGGLAVQARDGVRVTTGNSYTTWAAMRALEAACTNHGISLADCTVAVVGATGAIGHALSILCAERACELILIGNPLTPDASMGRLQLVAQECRQHVRSLGAAGRKFRTGSLAEELMRRPDGAIADFDHKLIMTTDIDRHLPRAHVVVTATNAVLPFISGRHLRNGAMVCDVSRPFNIAPALFDERPDVRQVDGGLVLAPDTSRLGLLEDRNRRNVLVACAAETIILALSGFCSEHLCGRPDIATVEELGRLAAKLGFSAAS